MIETADFLESTWKTSPQRFEAGTPAIAQAIGLGAAADYVDQIGRQNIFDHDSELARLAIELMSDIPGIRILGPKGTRAGVVSFVIEGIHSHDIVTMADRYGLALRGGHHCTQPLLKKLGVPSSCRASFYFYNTAAEVEAMAGIIRKVQTFLA